MKVGQPLFDAHCHVQDPRIDTCRDQWLKEARELGVQRWTCNGTCPEDWNRVRDLARKTIGLVPSYGLHPWYVTRYTSDLSLSESPLDTGHDSTGQGWNRTSSEMQRLGWMEKLMGLLDEDPMACVGEIGLDFTSRRAPDPHSIQLQLEATRMQVRLAKERSRPATLHCVHAHHALLQLLREEGPFPHGVLVHGYADSPESIPGLVGVGASFSVGGHLLKKKETKVREILGRIPLDRLMVETDCPDGYLRTNMNALETPIQGLNHPGNIVAILNELARMIRVGADDLANLTYKNAERMFLQHTGTAPNKTSRD